MPAILSFFLNMCHALTEVESSFQGNLGNTDGLVLCGYSAGMDPGSLIQKLPWPCSSTGFDCTSLKASQWSVGEIVGGCKGWPLIL